MTQAEKSHGSAHFQRIYDTNKDPWNYWQSEYERVKRDTTIGALDGRQFASALEVGCSIGALTRRLADHCDRLLAVDFIERALLEAKAACADKPNVTFMNARIPIAWPDGEFDLIVLSEVLYLLSTADNLALAGRCKKSLSRGGEVLLVNWLGNSPDDPCSGVVAATRFIEVSKPYLRITSSFHSSGFRLDKLRLRTDAE